MKKYIAILAVLIAFVGAAFAVTGEQLQINATVTPVAPVFSIFGGKTSNEAAGTTYQGNATTATNITFTENLAETDVVLYIRLWQSNKAKYSNTASLTVTATPLTNTTVSVGTYKTAAPTAGSISKTESPAGITYATNPAASTVDGNTVVSYAPKYDGRSINATDIGTFTLTWGANADLAAGSYTATVTLGYTAP